MPQNHPRSILDEWHGRRTCRRKDLSVCDRSNPCRFTPALRTLSDQQRAACSVNDVAHSDTTVSKEDALAINPRLADAEYADVVGSCHLADRCRGVAR